MRNNNKKNPVGNEPYDKAEYSPKYGTGIRRLLCMGIRKKCVGPRMFVCGHVIKSSIYDW